MKNRIFTQIGALIVASLLSLAPLSKTAAQTPLPDLFDSTKIQEIKLYFSQTNWDYLLDTAAAGAESYIFCRRAIINGVAFDSIGAKYKGNSTFSPTRKKNPWHLELDTYKDQDYDGIKDIKLTNIWFDPSCVREALGFDILQNYAHAPRANFAKVWVNDTLMGLFTNTEAITKTFGRREFKSTNANNAFFKCNAPNFAGGGGTLSRTPNLAFISTDSSRYFGAYEMKSDFGWKQLVGLTDTLTNKFSEIEKIMNIDRAIWMMAFNNIFVNLDSYSGSIGHNHYLWRDDNDRWNNIVWDINMAFASFRNTGLTGTGGTVDTLTAIRMSPFLHQTTTTRPLLYNILNHQTYRRMYVAHMRTMLNENFINGSYKQKALRWHNLIDAAVLEDPNKFSTYPLFKTNLYYASANSPSGTAGIFSLMDKRSRFLMDSFAEFYAFPPTISTPSVFPVAPRLNDSVWFAVRLAAPAPITGGYLGFRDNDRAFFRKTPLFDDGLHRDGAANDGVWGAGIKATSATIEYYIYAENLSAGMFSPERAEHEFHKLTVLAPSNFAKGDVVINEVMADNSRTARNTAGNFEDWVELHNRTNQAVSLAGAFLSDDAAFRNKWKFPATATIPANSYLIVWCDDDSLNTSDVQPHANFKLSNNGESVFLTNTSFVLVDSVKFGKQKRDTTWARFPNGTGAFRLLLPTFNATNVVTSTQDAAALAAIQLYPNPTEGYLTIEKLSGDPLSNLTVFNALGQTVFSLKRIDNQQVTLDLRSFVAGVYFLKIDDLGLRKFVLQH